MKLTAIILSRSGDVDDKVTNSVEFADEVIIVTDAPQKTRKITGRHIYLYRPLAGNFAAQRNYAIDQASGDWVLFIDDDEIVSSELQREITAVIGNTSIDAYQLKREDVCYHHVLRHGETSDTKIIRLMRKGSGEFVRPVHESWITQGKVGSLHSPLYHIKDHFVSEFIGRIAKYGPIDAKALDRENKPFSVIRLHVNPKMKFLFNYYLKLGFLDGYPGLFLSYLMSIQSLSVRVFQWSAENLSSQ